MTRMQRALVKTLLRDLVLLAQRANWSCTSAVGLPDLLKLVRQLEDDVARVREMLELHAGASDLLEQAGERAKTLSASR